jgi:hypothetical protein
MTHEEPDRNHVRQMVASRNGARQHQRFPVDAMQRLLADQYVGGVYCGFVETNKRAAFPSRPSVSRLHLQSS